MLACYTQELFAGLSQTAALAPGGPFFFAACRPDPAFSDSQLLWTLLCRPRAHLLSLCRVRLPANDEFLELGVSLLPLVAFVVFRALESPRASIEQQGKNVAWGAPWADECRDVPASARLIQFSEVGCGDRGSRPLTGSAFHLSWRFEIPTLKAESLIKCSVQVP
jgi:hypothetical protein